MTDLFYLRGMDVGSVNIPNLLARYLWMFALGMKRRAMIFGGQFICEELDDTWTWVAQGPERQRDVATCAPKVTKGAPDIAKSLPLRMARLEEEVHGMRGALDDGSCWVRYTSYSDFQILYVRRTWRRTDDASTSAPQQPDP
nr:hypothetical protein [Tanacetum cinerariifolium]